MFGWVPYIPLIFKLLRGKLSRSLFHVKINSQLTHSSRGCCLLCNIFKSLLKDSFFVHFYFLGSSSQRAPMSSILQYQTLSLQLYLLQDEACPLINEARSKLQQTPVKPLIIQFHLYLSTNKQWLADFKILSISSNSSNCTNIAILHEAHFAGIDHNKLCYSLKHLIF